MSVITDYIESLENVIIEEAKISNSEPVKVMAKKIEEDRILRNITMDMVDVKSNNISKIGYNQEKQILRVEFANTGLYQYSEVPKTIYDEMVINESVGTYFSKNIRNIFKCTKLR